MMHKFKKSFGKKANKSKSPQNPASNDDTTSAAPSPTPERHTAIAFPVGPSTWVEREDAEFDICFIHGLTGNRDTTWTAKGVTEPWPKKLLPIEFPDAKVRIMTYGYDAYITRWGSASSNQMIDHASTFLQKITADREKARATARPLIIVAHSLGGLVTKQAILQSKNSPEPHLQSLFKMTKGIIFMGTPHTGSWMADWFKLPADIFGIVKSSNTSLLRVLQTNDELLRSLNQDFLSLLRVLREGDGQKIHVTCFYEELAYPKFGRIVSQSSATFASDTPISVHANHSGMVKFDSANDEGFQSVAGELRRWMKDLSILNSFQHQKSPSPASHRIEPVFSVAELVPGLPDTQRSRTAISACLMALNLQDAVSKLHSPSTSKNQQQMQERENLKKDLTKLLLEAVSRCRRSLAFDNMLAREEIIARPESDTCQWIYHNNRYMKWSNDRRSLLWIKGKPGSGKSTLMKSLFKHRGEVLKNSGVVLLRFFFNARGSDIERTSEALYRTLLHNLIQLDQVTLYEVLATYLNKEAQTLNVRWNSIELAEMFHDKIEQPGMGDVEVLIDALDECSDTEVLSIVRRFERSIQMNSHGTILRICWSSRFYPHIGFTIAQGTDLVVNGNNEQDIQAYIEKIFNPTVYPSLQSVSGEIIRRADGIFLWASLVADRLLRAFNAGKVAKQLSAMLQHIPDGLENLFLEIFDEAHFDAEQRQDLRRIAVVVLSALRPMSLEELYATLVLSEPRVLSCFNDAILADEMVEQFKRRVTHASGGLIETVTQTQDKGSIASLFDQNYSGSKGTPRSGLASQRLRGSNDDSYSESTNTSDSWWGIYNDGSPELADQSYPESTYPSFQKEATTRVQVIHESVREFLLGRGLSILQMPSREAFGHIGHLELARASIEGLSRLNIDVSANSVFTGGKSATNGDNVLAGLIPQVAWHPPPSSFLLGYVVDHFFTHLAFVFYTDAYDGASRPGLLSSTVCREALFAYLRMACHEAMHSKSLRTSLVQQLRIGRSHADIFEMTDESLANYLDFPARLLLISDFFSRRGISIFEGKDDTTVVGEADDVEKVVAIFTISREVDTEQPHDRFFEPKAQQNRQWATRVHFAPDDAYVPCISRNLSPPHQSSLLPQFDLQDVPESFTFILGMSFYTSATVAARILLPDRLLQCGSRSSERVIETSSGATNTIGWQIMSAVDSDMLCWAPHHLLDRSGCHLTFSESFEPNNFVCHLFHDKLDSSESRDKVQWILLERGAHVWQSTGKFSDHLTLFPSLGDESGLSVCLSSRYKNPFHDAALHPTAEIPFGMEYSSSTGEASLDRGFFNEGLAYCTYESSADCDLMGLLTEGETF